MKFARRAPFLVSLGLVAALGCGDGNAGDDDAGANADAMPPTDAPIADADSALTILDVMVTDNPNSEISCFVSFRTNLPATSSVEFGETATYQFRIAGAGPATEHSVLVIGMHADTEYHLRATAATAGGDIAVSADLTYTTGPLPASVWTGKTETADLAKIQPGWTLTQGGKGPPTAVLYDGSGQPVWYFVQDTEDDGRVDLNVGLDPATNHIVLGPPTVTVPAVEVDLAGNVVWVGPLGTATGRYHHHFEKLPDQTYVTLQKKQVDTVKGDVIVVLDQAKQVVWSWDAFDHLTPPSAPSVLEWLHCNAISIDQSAGVAYLSSRTLSTIYKLDLATGDVIWELGQGGDFANPSLATYPWFEGQHDPEMQPNGNILLYDNGGSRPFSRVIEYALDEDERTATPVWEFPGDAEVDSYYTDDWFTQTWGGVQRLDNGNTLITIGSRYDAPPSRIVEVTSDREVVWEFIPQSTDTITLYRSHRVPELIERIAR